MNTFQKRMSAALLLLSFRGGLVDAAEAGFTQGNRQAASWTYSGILANTPTPPAPPTGGPSRGKFPLAALVTRSFLWIW